MKLTENEVAVWDAFMLKAMKDRHSIALAAADADAAIEQRRERLEPDHYPRVCVDQRCVSARLSLRNVVDARDEWHRKHDAMKEQRDELLSALKECSFRFGILVAATNDFTDVNKRALDAATAAMNKAKDR